MDFRKKIRFYEISKDIFVGVSIAFLTFLSLVFFPPKSIGNLLPVSYALITGTIAYIGIQQALFLSKDKERLYLKKKTLDYLIESVEKLYNKPSIDIVLKKMYEDCIKAWIRERIRVLTFYLSLLYYFDLVVLILFIAVPLSNNVEYLSELEIDLIIYNVTIFKSKLPIIIFYIALGLIFSILYTHINIVKEIENVTFPKKGKGQIWIKNINRNVYDKPQKEFNYDASGKDELNIQVSFKGKVSNGFFDTKVYFVDNKYVYYPDRNTFLSDFYLTSPQVLVLTELPIETGIIQGKRCFENTVSTLTFELIYTSDNKQIGHLLKNNIITRLEISLYEDPIFLPSDKPRGGRIEQEPFRDRFKIDTVIVNLKY
jgi:hypothetical protein